MTPAMEERIRQARRRALLRDWEYRQRRHAKGVWYRLRRLLTDASEMYVVSEQEARRLLQEGCTEENVGGELEPPKTLFFASREQIERIQDKRPIRVSLNIDFLAARWIAMVRFQ